MNGHAIGQGKGVSSALLGEVLPFSVLSKASMKALKDVDCVENMNINFFGKYKSIYLFICL